MTDPFSITVGVVGVVAPAAHCVRLLLDDLRRIKDAPDEVKTLTGELDTINGILESLDKLPKEQWESLGETIPTLTEKASKLCGDSCTKFKDDLRRWTQHGPLLGRVTIGFSKQRQIKSMSTLLQSCKGTLSLVLIVAALYVGCSSRHLLVLTRSRFASLGQEHAGSGTTQAISNPEADIATAIQGTSKQLIDAPVQLQELVLAGQDPDDAAEDKTSAITQAANEQAFLGVSRELLEALLPKAQEATAKGQTQEHSVSVRVGTANQSIVSGVNRGTISYSYKDQK